MPQKTVKKIKKKTSGKKPPAKKIDKYFEAVGRRKTSIARVRLFEKHKNKGVINVNEKELGNYFPHQELQTIVKLPLEKTRTEKKFYISVKICGGGVKSQAEALRHGISRALLKFKPDLRKILKPAGFLTRDAREKERRKFGLKKARKAPQWSKR